MVRAHFKRNLPSAAMVDIMMQFRGWNVVVLGKTCESNALSTKRLIVRTLILRRRNVSLNRSVTIDFLPLRSCRTIEALESRLSKRKLFDR